ncbi:MAG: M23 family metallopeptidase [Firmicutes bacterium]|nr:M23 family metallopeptidase [Bacillota bacterium]
MYKIWPLVVMVCLLAFPQLTSGEKLSEWKLILDQLKTESQVSMTWPCSESDSLAVASDTASKRYTFRTEGEEMQVFSSAGGTVVEAGDQRIVISHGNALETVYLGCTDIYVQPLQKVWKGELIGSIRPLEEKVPELEFQILKEQEPVDIGDYF